MKFPTIQVKMKKNCFPFFWNFHNFSPIILKFFPENGKRFDITEKWLLIFSDAVTLILKQEGFDIPTIPGGIHLARSLIDRLLDEKEKEDEKMGRTRGHAQNEPKLIMRSMPQPQPAQNNVGTPEDVCMDGKVSPLAMAEAQAANASPSMDDTILAGPNSPDGVDKSPQAQPPPTSLVEWLPRRNSRRAHVFSLRPTQKHSFLVF